MKHIKPYKIFESNDLLLDVEDILLELKDEGYRVDVSMTPQGVDAFYIEVSNDNLFQWSDVEECVTRSKDYTCSNGWKLVKINLGFYGPVVRIKEFMTFSGSNWNYFIHYITHPEFIKNNKIYEISLVFESNKHVMKLPNWAKTFESNDNFLLDCQDILLELKDNGFDVQFRFYPNYNNPEAELLAEINISKRDESNMNKPYNFEEISESIFRLNDFLKLNNKKATIYESPQYNDLDYIVKTWGKYYRLKRLTIYLEQ